MQDWVTYGCILLLVRGRRGGDVAMIRLLDVVMLMVMEIVLGCCGVTYGSGEGTSGLLTGVVGGPRMYWR